KGSKSIHERPDGIVRGAEVMWPVGVDTNPAGVGMVVDIAAKMAAALEDKHVPAGVGERARDDCSREAGADDEVIGFHPAGAMCPATAAFMVGSAVARWQ